MKVIGAGFGRTGTLSLKTALEALGVGPCYHMAEVFAHPEHLALWEAAARGEAVDWRGLFEGWGATVDWPGCNFYREILEAHPEAKVLLSVRDPARWYASCYDTIYSLNRLFPMRVILPRMPRMAGPIRMAKAVVWQGSFGGRFEDREHAIGVFLAHIAAVQATVPADRLLVYDVQEGWEPLCAFLGVPVPARPFPHVNDGVAVRRMMRAMNAFSWLLLLSPALLIVGLVVYFWTR